MIFFNAMFFHTYDVCSESDASSLIMLDPDIRGEYLWYSSRG